MKQDENHEEKSRNTEQEQEKFDGFLGTKSAAFSFRSVCVVLHHFKSFYGGFYWKYFDVFLWCCSYLAAKR